MNARAASLVVLFLLSGAPAALAQQKAEGEDGRYSRLTQEVICACPDENWTRTLQSCPDGCANPQKFELRALMDGEKTEQEIVKFLRFVGGTAAVRSYARGGKTAEAAAEALRGDKYTPEEALALVEGGLSDEEILAFMRARHGPKVIARAPFAGIHRFIYIAPALLLLLGAYLIVRYLRRKPREEEPGEAPAGGDETWQKKLDAELEEMT